MTSRIRHMRKTVPCAFCGTEKAGFLCQLKARTPGRLKETISIFRGNDMAAGCCGTKKQKLNNSTSVPSCNGTSTMTNGCSNGMVALPEMCFFCFDVLYCQLYNLDPPKTPNFSNDA